LLCFLFRARTGRLTIATDEVVEPNGLAFSPDESVLYVADTSIAFDPKGNHHIMAFDVVGGRKLQNGRVFAVIDPGAADGFRVDVRGNVFTSSADSVQVYANDGTRLGKIPIPEKVGNLTFGGPRRERLYIAASTSLYALDLNTQGVQRP
jgi:gluconolactonase